MRVMCVVGARPQFVKLAPLAPELRNRNIDTVVIHTGQHYSDVLSREMFQALDLKQADYNLGVGSGTHAVQTGRMLERLESVMVREDPTHVIVFGDTNTTIAGALTAAKLNLPVVHVEAGIRSLNWSMPEEVNRVLTDHASDLLLAPTQTAMVNLEREGLGDRSVLTGDIMVDALQRGRQEALTDSSILKDTNLRPHEYSVLTLHRPANVDSPTRLEATLKALGRLGERIVFPLHPRTEKTLRSSGIELPPTISGLAPVGYVDFIRLQIGARRVITDSGGVQKEAYLLRRPCITLREETEWVETVENGWNILLDPEDPEFVAKVLAFNPEGAPPLIFGQSVATKMVDAILSV